MTRSRERDIGRGGVYADDAAGGSSRGDSRREGAGSRTNVQDGIAVPHPGEPHERRGEGATPPAHETFVGLTG
jgi:hypothetical protein